MKSFLSANPGFNLQTADLFSANALARYNWPDGADKKTLLQALRTRQRLLKVYPDEKVAAALETLGLHSAHHIASLQEMDFAAKVLPALARLEGTGDARALAAQIFLNAGRIRRASFELALAQPRVMSEAVVKTPDHMPDFQNGTPDYERLFGPMLTCDCDECQSIFGPAAYFTDLMRIVTNYVDQPDESKFRLEYRRPDLWALPLDCNTAETEVSYLDIINSVLKQNLSANFTNGTDPMQAIATAVYPFNTPYNEPLETVHTGLNEMGTSLAEVYQIMETAAPASASAALNLSPEALSLVNGTGSSQTWQLYGFYSSPSDIGQALSDQKTFLQQTGLKPDELKNLVYQDLKQGFGSYCFSDNGSQDADTAEFEDDKLTRSITIECWLYPTGQYASMSVVGKGAPTEFSLHLNYGYLNVNYAVSGGTVANTSINHIGLNAWTHVAWTRDTSSGVNNIYINGVMDSSWNDVKADALSSNSSIELGFFGGTSYHGAVAELRIWSEVRGMEQIRSLMFTRLEDFTQAALFAYWPLNESTGNTAHDLCTNGYDLNNAHFTFFESVPLGGTTEMNPALAFNLYLNYRSGENIIPAYLTTADSLYNNSTKAFTPASIVITDGQVNGSITIEALNMIAVYIRLQRKTGWTFTDLDWILKSVSDEKPVDNQIIGYLAKVVELKDKYDIPLDQLSAFWYDMKTYGRGNGIAPQDLWDKVFNTPPMLSDMDNTGEFAFYRPTYSLNPFFTSPVIAWKPGTGATNTDTRINNQLSAALNISSADLAAIVDYLAPGASSINLTVPAMSQFYRMARFAQMLGMPVQDFISLLHITDMGFAAPATVWTPDNVILICNYASWLKKAKLSVSQLAFLTTSSAPTAGLRLPDPSAVQKALDTMVGAAAQVKVRPESFVSPAIDSATAQEVYTQLVAQKFIDYDGLVLNIKELTLIDIYQAISADADLAKRVIHGGPASYVIDFSAGNGDTVGLTFDPFVNAAIQSTNSFTINLWMKPASTYTGGWPRIVGNTQESTGEKSPGIRMVQDEDKRLQVESNCSNGQFYARQAGDYLQWPDEWVFVSWVNSNGTWTLFRNAEPVQFLSGGDGPFSTPYTQTGDTPTYYIASAYSGCVSNVAIWDVARTAEELQQDMFALYAGNESGLLAYWPMNEGQGAVINNITAGGTDYNGTFTNSKDNKADWVPNSGLEDLQRIMQVLTDARDGQNGLVVKTLAGLSSLTQQVMSGVCALSSNEVDNSGALGVLAAVPYPPNMLLNADISTNTNRQAYLTQVQLNGALARWFNLTGEEVAGIGNYLVKFSPGTVLFDIAVYTVSQLMAISDYRSVQQLCNTKNGLTGYFKMAPAPADPNPYTPAAGQLTLLTQLTGWNEAELNAIVIQPCFADINFNTAKGLRKLADIMAMEKKVNMGIASLAMLGSMVDYTVSANWQAYQDTAVAVTGALTVKAGTQSLAKLQGTLNREERNVLCGLLIWYLSASIRGVTNTDELYEYLLMDVNMSPDVKTSWTVAAMNSLQLYVNRCISNMEPDAVNNIPAAWWKWMSTYRVWQANREVYLYPENYVDPGLRKLQSPQFRQFINDVSKGQINDDNVKQALVTYLEGVNGISNLELIDGFVDPYYNLTKGTSQDNKKNVIFLTARSRTSPADFYTRTVLAVTSSEAVNDGVLPDDASNIHFGAWTKIGLKINSDFVSTVTAFGRQFIFWAEQTEIVNTDDNDKKYTTVYADIYYSYRDLQETWVSPVVLQKDIILSVFGKHITGTNYFEEYLYGAHLGNSGSGKAYPFYKEEAWKKVRLQYLPAVSGADESILVTLGDLVSCEPGVDEAPGNISTGDMPGEQAVFQTQLHAAAKFTYGNKTYITGIVPAVLLFSSLLQKPVRFAANSQGANFVEGMLEKVDGQTRLGFAVSGNLIYQPLPERVSWWPLVNNDGLTTTTKATDIVSGNDGTASTGSNSPTWTTGAFGNMPSAGIPLFSTTKYFSLPRAIDLDNNTSTVAFWIEFTATNSGYFCWLPRPSNYSTSVVFVQCYFSGSAIVVTYYNKSSTLQKAYVNVSLNTWYFVTVTNTTSGVQLYLNGVLQTLTAYSSTLSYTTVSQLQIGRFVGYAFDVQFWDLPLTSQEIQFLYGTNLTYPYLTGLHGHSSSLYRLSNSAGAFAFNTGNQAYLVFPDLLTRTRLISQCITASYLDNIETLQITFNHTPIVAGTTLPLMRFIRVNTDTIPVLIATLARNGIKALFDPAIQYLPELTLLHYSPSELTKLPVDDIMNFNGACSVYFWELFFYAPYLIAEKLRSSRRFDEAEKWYRYIFDPTSSGDMPEDKWYDFLLDSQSPTAPVAYWPVNRNTGAAGAELFADIKGTYDLTGTGLTSNIEQRVPFAFLDRTTWTFGTNTTAVTGANYGDLNPSKFTITAWVNLAGKPDSGSNCTIVNSQSGYNGYHFLFSYVSTDVWRLSLNIWGSNNNGTATWQSVYSQGLSQLGEWQFVAGRFDGKEMKVYINGKNVTQQNGINITNYTKNTTGPFRVGCGNSAGTGYFYFKGQIADVGLYNYAMKGHEIKALYENYTSVGPNSAFWKAV